MRNTEKSAGEQHVQTLVAAFLSAQWKHKRVRDTALWHLTGRDSKQTELSKAVARLQEVKLHVLKIKKARCGGRSQGQRSLI